MTSLIYIGGYGRSGSTLLESLLTTRAGVLACGEVTGCLRKRIDRGCTCGQARTECEVWGPIYNRPGGPRGMTHDQLTLALLEGAAGDYGFLVDSSKTAWGSFGAPFTLQRTLGDRFHLVHLVRDPRGVCWSNAGGTRKRGVVALPVLQHLKTSLGWWAANLSCEIFRWLRPSRYTRVRYDDMARSHQSVLQRLLGTLSNGDAASGTKGTNNRHQLYGNHNRYKSFRPAEISEDVRWKTAMPRAQQVLVKALTWPLRRRYGY